MAPGTHERKKLTDKSSDAVLVQNASSLTGKRSTSSLAFESNPTEAFKVLTPPSQFKSKTDVRQMQKYAKISPWTLLVQVGSHDASTPQPIFVADASLHEHIFFVRKPIIPFRFLDLPAELRAMVYGYLIKEKRLVKIGSYKVHPFSDTRPIQDTFRCKRFHRDLDFDKDSGKWIGQPPSDLGIMRVNKQILREMAPNVYGGHEFEFQNLGDMAVFLRSIGSMRTYLTNITITGQIICDYSSDAAQTKYKLLSDAISLRSITFYHHAMRSANQAENLEELIEDIRPLMKKQHNVRKSGNRSKSVLDIIHVVPEKCYFCREARKDRCTCVRHGQHEQSIESAQQCANVEAQIRSLLAEALQIKT